MGEWQADPAAGGRWRRARAALAIVALVAGAFVASRAMGGGDGAAELTVGTDERPAGEQARPGPAPPGVGGSWRALPDSPMSSRAGHVAVWTGAEMLVWGGERHGQPLTDGAAYDPLADTWRRLPPTGGVDAGLRPSPLAAVWTGRDMVVLGPGSGRAYRPADDTWRDLAPPPPGPWLPASAGWTGEEVVVLADGQRRAAGFDPDRNAWRELPGPPVTGAPGSVSVELLGAIVVLGASEGSPAIVRYDPRRDAWLDAEAAPVADVVAAGGSPQLTADPAGRRVLLAGHDGEEQAVWGWSPGEGWERFPDLPDSLARRSVHLHATAGAVVAWAGSAPAEAVVRPRSSPGWRDVARSPLRARRDATEVWTGDELLVWGGLSHGEPVADGAALRAGSDADRPRLPAAGAPEEGGGIAGTWYRLPSGPLPGRSPPQITWTGTHVLTVDQPTLATVAAYDPAGAVWRLGPRGPRPHRRVAHTSVWTGQELVLITAYGGGPARPLDGVAYDPAAGTWRVLASSPEQATGPVSAAWTGEEIVVLAGGRQPAALRYEPAADRWRVLDDPPLSGQPAALASAGGVVLALSSGVRDNVARLDLDTGAWRSGADRPVAALAGQPLAWTGSGWVVSGGGDPGATAAAAVYDLAADRWRVVDEPPGRVTAAVATGWERHPLLVVGPEGLRGGAPGPARLYDPGADRWRALPPMPPWMRSAHAAVWTGEQLLVWSAAGDAAAFLPAGR